MDGDVTVAAEEGAIFETEKEGALFLCEGPVEQKMSSDACCDA